MASSLCSNCEFAEVELRCIQCIEAKEDGLFCGSCSRIHVKVKKYKQHVFEKVIRPCPFCFNCEEQIATHRCVDCVDGEQYLCRSCSSFHGKVKCYKDHRVVKHADDNERTNDGSSNNNNISITYSSPSLSQRMEDIVDDWNSWFARTRLSSLLDFTHVKTPPPKVYIPLIIGTAISFLILRPLIGKHGSSVVTILGSLIVLRVMQSPPSINQSMNEWNSKASRTGKQKRVQMEDYALTPSSMPQLTGSGKLSRQRNNPPLVLKSALSSGNHTTTSPALMTTDTSHPSMTKNKGIELNKKQQPVQFGAMAGWEDKEEDFSQEFSYKRCSEAATLKPRGPAYHGRTRHKRRTSTEKNPADSE